MVKNPYSIYYMNDDEREDKLDEDIEKALKQVAYSLCPGDHDITLPCDLCNKLFQALEKAYKDGCEACY